MDRVISYKGFQIRAFEQGPGQWLAGRCLASVRSQQYIQRQQPEVVGKD